MPTPTQVAAQVLQDLMDKKLIELRCPKTKEVVTIQHEAASNLVDKLAYHSYDAIKGINVHRPLDIDVVSLAFKTDAELEEGLNQVENLLKEQGMLEASDPAADEPMSEEKLKELDKALAPYET